MFILLTNQQMSSDVRAEWPEWRLWRFGADDGIRTRDPHLGKVMLYQLSHVRLAFPPCTDDDTGRGRMPASPAGGPR